MLFGVVGMQSKNIYLNMRNAESSVTQVAPVGSPSYYKILKQNFKISLCIALKFPLPIVVYNKVIAICNPGNNSESPDIPCNDRINTYKEIINNRLRTNHSLIDHN